MDEPGGTKLRTRGRPSSSGPAAFTAPASAASCSGVSLARPSTSAAPTRTATGWSGVTCDVRNENSSGVSASESFGTAASASTRTPAGRSERRATRTSGAVTAAACSFAFSFATGSRRSAETASATSVGRSVARVATSASSQGCGAD